MSPKFKLYLIRDYQRLKADEQKQIGWTAKRELAKINAVVIGDGIFQPQRLKRLNEIAIHQMRLGATGFSSDMVFAVPKGTVVPVAYKEKAERMGYVGDYTRLGNSCWYTNIEHGRRHQPLQLMTEADNIKFSSARKMRCAGSTGDGSTRHITRTPTIRRNCGSA